MIRSIVWGILSFLLGIFIAAIVLLILDEGLSLALPGYVFFLICLICGLLIAYFTIRVSRADVSIRNKLLYRVAGAFVLPGVFLFPIRFLLNKFTDVLIRYPQLFTVLFVFLMVLGIVIGNLIYKKRSRVDIQKTTN